MAQCAVTGQTVVSRHYVKFQPKKGKGRYYALRSPDPVREWAGTIPTTEASLDEVAKDIAGLEVDGELIWNPLYIRTDKGGVLEPLALVRIPIKAGTAKEVEAQIRAGGPARVETEAVVEGAGAVKAQVNLMLTPWREAE